MVVAMPRTRQDFSRQYISNRPKSGFCPYKKRNFYEILSYCRYVQQLSAIAVIRDLCIHMYFYVKIHFYVLHYYSIYLMDISLALLCILYVVCLYGYVLYSFSLRYSLHHAYLRVVCVNTYV